MVQHQQQQQCFRPLGDAHRNRGYIHRQGLIKIHSAPSGRAVHVPAVSRSAGRDRLGRVGVAPRRVMAACRRPAPPRRQSVVRPAALLLVLLTCLPAASLAEVSSALHRRQATEKPPPSCTSAAACGTGICSEVSGLAALGRRPFPRPVGH